MSTQRVGMSTSIEPIVGIEKVVAEVLERSAVKRVRAGLGDDRDLCAWSAPIFRREARSLNPKLLQRIQRHQVASPAEGAGCRKLDSPALS